MITLPFQAATDVELAAGRVAQHLRRGGLIAYPTETVYGFGCALRPPALEKLARLKSRSAGKAFLVLVTDAAMLRGLVWTPSAQRLAAAFWPGPLTLVLRCGTDALPDRVTGPGNTVAIRATSHPGIRRLLQIVGEPITSTSANAAGGEPARSASQLSSVLENVAADDDIIVLDGGPLPPSASSTIVDCSVDPPVVLRQGAIATAQLVEIDHGIRTLESAGRGR